MAGWLSGGIGFALLLVAPPADDVRRADALLATAESRMLADPAAAEAAVREAVAIREELFGRASFPAAIARAQLALVRALAGDRARQLAPLDEAARAAATAAATPAEREEAAVALLTAAQFADSGGRRDRAEAARRRGLDLLGQADTAIGANAAQTYDIAADLAQRWGRFDESLALSARAITIWETRSSGNAELSRSLGNAADVLLRLGRHGEAEPMLRRALAVADAARPAATHLQLLALQKLAAFHRETARPDLAETLLRRALGIAETMPRGFRYALAIDNDLAALALARGRPAAARPYAARAAELAEVVLGTGSAERGGLLLLLAEIDLQLADPDRAAASAALAEEAFAQALVPGDPRRGDLLATQGRIAAARGDRIAAAQLLGDAVVAMETRPDGNPARIAAERDTAIQLLALGEETRGWPLARAAADALTRRLTDQARRLGQATLLDDSARATYETAVDLAWARARRR